MTRTLFPLAVLILLSGCGERPATEMVADSNSPETQQSVDTAPIPSQDEPPLSASTEPTVVPLQPTMTVSAQTVLPPTPFEKLCAAYTSGDGDAWATAEKELFELGPKATPALVAALNQGASHERELAASMLAQIGSITTEARAALKAALTDESLFVQANAAATLCAIEDDSPEVLSALNSLLEQDDKGSRMMAITSAGNLGTKGTSLVPKIEPLLEAEDAELRDVAATAIARIKGEEIASDDDAEADDETTDQIETPILPASSSKPID